jgi:diguanylate cyclase (GGDEF)-like protein
LSVILYAGWAANSSASAREKALFGNALNHSILRILNEQKSVAWWDEAYATITSAEPNMEFLDSEFGIFLSETYGHDVVAILDPDNKPIFMFSGGARRNADDFHRYRNVLAPVLAEIRQLKGRSLRTRPDLFGADQNTYRTIGSPLQSARWTGHLLTVDGAPAAVGALTILPNVDTSLLKPGRPHVLISVNMIDEAYLQEQGRSLLLPDLTLGKTAKTGSEYTGISFETDDGKIAGWINWKTERPGNSLTSIILPLVAAGFIAAAVQAWVMLQRLRNSSSHLAQQEKRSRYAAKHDALSGLANRAHFAEHLGGVLAGIDPDGMGQTAVVAYLDVDRFKEVNDTLGHSAGDTLIQEVAKRLSTHVRSGDFIARYGGDEFTILWKSADPNAPQLLASRIARALLQPIEIEGQPMTVTASVGIAISPEHGRTVDEVMRHADIALYEAKNAGRNRSILFSADMAEQVEQRRAVETDLQSAIAHDELDVAYQPIVSCETGAIVGIEALARWTHPKRGFISPSIFIPIAEQGGLMPLLGERILARTMRDWHAWPHLEVSVNLSPLQFRQSDVVAILERMVAEYKIDPSCFVLEITEGVLMDAGERTLEALEKIRKLGFRMALDDFGTGYSSLAYLCNFQFDKIKIDRSFVSGLARSQSVRTIVQSVISLGTGLGMKIVAEGVEEQAEARSMTDFGCTEMQGYYFAKPMPRTALEKFIKTYKPMRVSEENPAQRVTTTA